MLTQPSVLASSWALLLASSHTWDVGARGGSAGLHRALTTPGWVPCHCRAGGHQKRFPKVTLL